MKRFVPVIFVLALLLAGAYMTSQSASQPQGNTPPPDKLEPEGSVFQATPDQKVAMVVLVLVVVGATLGLGFGLMLFLTRLPALLQPAVMVDGDDEGNG